jgi:polyferredoxin
MSNSAPNPEASSVTGLYHEHEEWTVNTGGKTIHAKRMPGKFRTLKYFTAATWLAFFLGAYLRWNGKQAILFDVTNRQFHFFNITILPQDIWMLSLLLLLMAMALFAVTSVASRVFCGYFCFQTVWTDVFTWIEEKVEGQPGQRRKLDAAPWSLNS